MARKSRKETAAVAVQEADAACRAAIYVRLSVEDTHTHSVSIETQQMIIARYLEQCPEISVYDTYIDNGATGTNFHRPGFQQMLSDIEAGHVNCVIVKDLSRLGRNTIDTGYYIEQYFRIRNIRFIAVNENFDTVAPEDAHSGIIIPLRNMINEAYAFDIGRKIRAQQRQAMKDGKFIGARTPYGYLKAEDDCHQLIIDPVAAVVVQRMFRWASEGAGLNTIAVRLNEAGVLTPSHYHSIAHPFPNSEDFFFYNHKKQPLSTLTPYIWLRRALEIAGIDRHPYPKQLRGVCVHCLRHTFAVHTLQLQSKRGIDRFYSVPILSTYMGHTDIYGTELYLRLTPECYEHIVDCAEKDTGDIFPEVLP